MSFKMMDWAWKQDLDPQAKLVLLFLADSHNGKDGRCHPSVSTIAKATGLSVSTTRRRLRDLEGRRLIATNQRRFANTATASNAYDIGPTVRLTGAVTGTGATVSLTGAVTGTGATVSLTGATVTADRPIEEPEENQEENTGGFQEGRTLSEGRDLTLDVELNGDGRVSVGRPNSQASNGYAWKTNGKLRH
jgi:hypothetical protein